LLGGKYLLAAVGKRIVYEKTVDGGHSSSPSFFATF
jgi:hypothetical protein